MRHIPLLPRAAAAGLVLAALASPAAAQTGVVPTVSGRTFTAGSAKVTVTGSFQIDQDIPINVPASFGDGGMTWIQFGVSGADAPNALITYQPGEMGIITGKGKFIATAGVMAGETPQCSGKSEVTRALVSGHYTCIGIASYNPATGKMGKVDIEVTFTAKS
jgi:hypothetical protein